MPSSLIMSSKQLERQSSPSTSLLVLDKVVNFWDIDTESVVNRPLREEVSLDEEVTSTTSQELDLEHQNREFRKQLVRLRQQIMMLRKLAVTKDEMKFAATGQQHKDHKSSSSWSRRAELELERSNLMKRLSSLKQENQILKCQSRLAIRKNKMFMEEKIDLTKLRDTVRKVCEEKIVKEQASKLSTDTNEKDLLFNFKKKDTVFNDRILG